MGINNWWFTHLESTETTSYYGCRVSTGVMPLISGVQFNIKGKDGSYYRVFLTMGIRLNAHAFIARCDFAMDGGLPK